MYSMGYGKSEYSTSPSIQPSINSLHYRPFKVLYSDCFKLYNILLTIVYWSEIICSCSFIFHFWMISDFSSLYRLFWDIVIKILCSRTYLCFCTWYITPFYPFLPLLFSLSGKCCPIFSFSEIRTTINIWLRSCEFCILVPGSFHLTKCLLQISEFYSSTAE